MERVNTPSPQHALYGLEAGDLGLQVPVGRRLSREMANQPIVPQSIAHHSDVGAAPSGDLWMVDHNSATVLRCRCLAVSATRMRLCVPGGSGVAAGQRYELSARNAGENPVSPLLGSVTFWVTVLQTHNLMDEDADRIEVSVAVDRLVPTPIGLATCDRREGKIGSD